MKRGYLLPEGCKDLMDVLKLKPKQPLPYVPAHLIDLLKREPQLLKFKPEQPLPHNPAPLPPILGEIAVPMQTTVSKLAALLGQNPLQIVADVLQLGFFVSTKQLLSFEIISSVARKYGFIAIKTV